MSTYRRVFTLMQQSVYVRLFVQLSRSGRSSRWRVIWVQSGRTPGCRADFIKRWWQALVASCHHIFMLMKQSIYVGRSAPLSSRAELTEGHVAAERRRPQLPLRCCTSMATATVWSTTCASPLQSPRHMPPPDRCPLFSFPFFFFGLFRQCKEPADYIHHADTSSQTAGSRIHLHQLVRQVVPERQTA